MNDDDVGMSGSDDVGPDQLRAARALVGWTLMEAGARAGLSVSGVAGLERERRGPPDGDVVTRVTRAYEAVGITFRSLPDGSRIVKRRPE